MKKQTQTAGQQPAVSIPTTTELKSELGLPSKTKQANIRGPLREPLPVKLQKNVLNYPPAFATGPYTKLPTRPPTQSSGYKYEPSLREKMMVPCGFLVGRINDWIHANPGKSMMAGQLLDMMEGLKFGIVQHAFSPNPPEEVVDEEALGKMGLIELGILMSETKDTILKEKINKIIDKKAKAIKQSTLEDDHFNAEQPYEYDPEIEALLEVEITAPPSILSPTVKVPGTKVYGPGEVEAEAAALADALEEQIEERLKAKKKKPKASVKTPEAPKDLLANSGMNRESTLYTPPPKETKTRKKK